VFEDEHSLAGTIAREILWQPSVFSWKLAVIAVPVKQKTALDWKNAAFVHASPPLTEENVVLRGLLFEDGANGIEALALGAETRLPPVEESWPPERAKAKALVHPVTESPFGPT
jgi:hypothetical protein